MKAINVKRTQNLEHRLQEGEEEQDALWRRSCARADGILRLVRDGWEPDLNYATDEVLTLLVCGMHPFEERWLTFEECALVEQWRDKLPEEARAAWDKADNQEDVQALARQYGYPIKSA